MRRKLAAGNWKMNGLTTQLVELDNILKSNENPAVDLLICPPATLIASAAKHARGSAMMIGGQDCHVNLSGAHTGDISAEMLRDSGALAVILGHSERRQDHNETDQIVCKKTQTAMENGLISVVCLGESLEQRESGETLQVIGAQLAGSVPDCATSDTLVIAYEPIWAIGTGLVPSLEQIAEVHDFIREKLTERFGTDMANGVRILYGGSVKPDNAAEIFGVSNVDGALVGGASLSAQDFCPIISALEAYA
ncbi:triose-phosphate isomerase [Thalassobius vesicularis]|uniref:Triosephosphate isomerase n=1 Tax=Thalassobius vesicularis TaxID=1294297 RepID=A0A4S3MB27_9RHOB|nr:triose-phosphate isomerase [Thalassobius vesicularis]THD74773.1 triose-phosphate isomerase [Thalassobius vesicularis]